MLPLFFCYLRQHGFQILHALKIARQSPLACRCALPPPADMPGRQPAARRDARLPPYFVRLSSFMPCATLLLLFVLLRFFFARLAIFAPETCWLCPVLSRCRAMRHCSPVAPARYDPLFYAAFSIFTPRATCLRGAAFDARPPLPDARCARTRRRVFCAMLIAAIALTSLMANDIARRHA